MKILRILFLLLLIPFVTGFDYVTNTYNVTNSVASKQYKDFTWTWSGYDDQKIVVNIPTTIIGTLSNMHMRLAAPRGPRGTVYLEMGATISTTSASYSVSRTNLPPSGRYFVEALHYAVTTTNEPTRVMAKGKVQVEASVYSATNQSSWVNPIANMVLGPPTHIITNDALWPFRLESADHTHASTGAEAGTVAHSVLTGLTSGDPHTQYGSLDGAETIAGNWVNTANPWADNEVSDTLTLTSSTGLPIASGLAVGTSANLNTVISDQTGSGVLVFGTAPTLTTPSIVTSLTVTDEDWIGLDFNAGRIKYDNEGIDVLSLLDANVRIGNGSPGTATGLEDLYVESDLEVDGNITGGTFKSVYVDEFFIWIDTAQSVGPALEQIEFDTEVYDPDGVADIADPWKVTFSGTGLCTICGYQSIASGSMVNDEVNQVLYKNGAQFLNLYSTAQGNAASITQGSGGGSCVTFYNDTASDYYTIYVSQGESSGKSLNGVQAKNYLMGYRLPE
jgi:hypothetical protein